jgi:hypothetical protein
MTDTTPTAPAADVPQEEKPTEATDSTAPTGASETPAATATDADAATATDADAATATDAAERK